MHCCHNPRSHITDSGFYSRGFTTAEARSVFCDFRRLQRWLEVESALALTQAELGLIPDSAGRELSRAADLGRLDCESIKAGITATGHSLIPLLNEWQKAAGPEAATFCHYGATTQDIQDTAQSLELKDIWHIINRDLLVIIELLSDLAVSHRDLVIIGRTHGQHALPTTLGLKIAIWLDEIQRHAERLQEIRERLLVSQLFGGVGTMDALGDHPFELLDKFSQRLGLNPPTTAWHTARDRGAEFVNVMALLTGTLAKIANEVCQLAKDETGELEEPFHMGKIGSTTMPHKRNPEMCEQVVVLHRLVKSGASVCLDGLINEHERDYRAVRLEWAGITDASLYSCGALDLMKNILQGLTVFPDRIRQNLETSACLISTEALMFLIGGKIGKPAAHQLLYETSVTARNSGKSLADLLFSHPVIKGEFDREQLINAVDPSRHTGVAGEITDRVVNKSRQWLNKYRASIKESDIPACPLSKPERGCVLL